MYTPTSEFIRPSHRLPHPPLAFWREVKFSPRHQTLHLLQVFRPGSVRFMFSALRLSRMSGAVWVCPVGGGVATKEHKGISQLQSCKR
ncbi:hypothetical protein E2C01_012131 [Portunus trituberculatus]|uniref:Uncharacterized protein n=1 Tax=Portunus trituberculatus TaxID=210409 RepID=A0A5B7DD14_PORTR|nr:hypothetical protein [Portunus trituberculatus]